MVQVGETAAIGGGGQPGFSPVLQGGDTGGPAVWYRVLDTVGRNDEGGQPSCVL